ncbi:unknown [Clostridium sp. CAG:780]|mgnify:FL=1|nr:unknown [Clostridium sp. CAG:780]
MKIEKEFTLLKIESKERTDDDENKRTYLIINVLDEDMETCKFFVFKDDLVNEIIKNANGVKAMQKVLIDMNLVYNGRLWNCNLEDILFSY